MDSVGSVLEKHLVAVRVDVLFLAVEPVHLGRLLLLLADLDLPQVVERAALQAAHALLLQQLRVHVVLQEHVPVLVLIVLMSELLKFILVAISLHLHIVLVGFLCVLDPP